MNGIYVSDTCKIYSLKSSHRIHTCTCNRQRHAADTYKQITPAEVYFCVLLLEHPILELPPGPLHWPKAPLSPILPGLTMPGASCYTNCSLGVWKTYLKSNAEEA